MIVGVDKSSNFFYKMQSETYSDLLEKAVHKNLKKAKEGEKEEITKVDKTTAIGLSISDRVFQTEMKKAKVTIKDHKADFMNKTQGLGLGLVEAKDKQHLQDLRPSSQGGGEQEGSDLPQHNPFSVGQKTL